ncbi:MAG: YceI family protein [Myxococcota bacterium]|nr:YceI family protein [Myxococcota bacterium]
MYRMSLLIALIAVQMIYPQRAEAEAIVFDFKDPKGVNSIGITLDSVLEPFRGVATGISGRVTFDPKQPKSISGSIAVEAKTIRMANDKMTEVLHGEDWLDVKVHPTVTATLDKVISARKVGKGEYALTVKGTFTCKGVSKPLRAKVQLFYHPGRLKERNHSVPGDLLIARTRFVIDRHDFGIKPEMDNTIVSREIVLDIALAGYAKQ